jgi:glyoxylate carboligase
MACTVADQMIEVLVQPGFGRVYGLVGDSLNPLADAIRRNPRFEWVHVHNEEAAALAAASEAQLTGQLAVSAGSCGPGNTHLVQGLYDAHRTGAPVLAIGQQRTVNGQYLRRMAGRPITGACLVGAIAHAGGGLAVADLTVRAAARTGARIAFQGAPGREQMRSLDEGRMR